MTEFLVNGPRWLLLATLVFAPWAYGGTQPSTVTALNALFALILTLWLAGALVRRSRPIVPTAVLWASLLLLLQGWWMVLNAKSDYDPGAVKFTPLAPLFNWAPGTLDKSSSLPAALRLSLMLGIGCFCCDLARRSIWRRRLLCTMGLTGVSIVILGLAQRLSGAEGIFWGATESGETFFATWRYHSNAGSFLNLVWPVTAALLLSAIAREEPASRKWFWGAALFLELAGVFVTSSRAANLIAIALFAAWFAWLAFHGKRGALQIALNPAFLLVSILILVVVLAGLAAFGGLDASLRRWGKFDQELSTRNARLLAAEVCLRMVPSAGACGFGPGTFQTAFPYFTREIGSEIPGVWVHAHDDYLETMIEWGWLGAAFWAVYVLGALAFSGWALWRYRRQISSSDRLNWFAAITALVGVLFHAGMDFPLQVPSIELYVAVLLGICWSCRSWLKKPDVLQSLSRNANASVHRPEPALR